MNNIHFKNIRMKNLATVGDEWLAIQLDRSPTTIVYGLNGSGKCLGKDTPVMMYDGSTKMSQDVVVGDVLMGDDGSPRRVLALSCGVDELYKVKQNKGMDYVVNSNHILSLKCGVTVESMGFLRGGIYNIPIKEYMSLPYFVQTSLLGYKAKRVAYGDTNISVEPVGVGEYYGFEVDGNHLYCLGDFTVTHNSAIMLDAIMYALYGKPFKKVKIGDIINNRNTKGMVVEVDLSKGSDEYKIVRGHKPSVFEIYKNNKLLDQTMTQQELIDKDIIGVPYNTFKQIVVMGKANYQSFMDMPKDKRREFVESILDISVFRHMLVEHKQQVKDTNTKLAFGKEKLKHKKELIETVVGTINSIKQAKDERKSNALTEVEEKLSSLNKQLSDIDIPTDTDELQAKVDKLKADRDKAEKLAYKVKTKDSGIVEILNFFKENDVCPTCNQDIDAKFKADNICKHEEEHNKYAGKLKELYEFIEKASDKIDTLERDIQSKLAVLFNVKSIKAEIERCELRRNEIMSKDDSSDDKLMKENKAKLKTLNDEYKEIKSNVAELTEKASIQEIATALLSDTGIKSFIINKYINTINGLVNSNLTKLGLFATIKFDEELKDTIKVRGFEDFSYNQLSEGEKLRVDLSIMLAWREIASMKSDLSINLLIMDEIFNGSMDYNGCKAFVELLNNKKGQNTFIVSPNSDEFLDLCYSSIELRKEDGFVNIVNTKER